MGLGTDADDTRVTNEAGSKLNSQQPTIFTNSTVLHLCTTILNPKP